MNMNDLKSKIIKEIEELVIKEFGQSLSLELEIPPNIKLADYTVACFKVAKILNLPPTEVAERIVKNFSGSEIINSLVVFGPYANVFVKPEILFAMADNLPVEKILQPETILIEYLSPNTNKPLHLGHVRNGAIATALVNVLQDLGQKTVRVNLVNDRGVHICKSMIAWQMFSQGATPDSTKTKGDHFVGDYYVKFNQAAKETPSLEQGAQSMLRQWEEKNSEVIELWNKMNAWVLAGFEETYANYGFIFDDQDLESKNYLLGKEIIAAGLERKIFYQDETGAIIFDLPVEQFGLDENKQTKKVTLQRSDGTSVYMTQDLGTFSKRLAKYKFDALYYIVGSEQKYHFQCLFTILKALGFKQAEKCRHISYGMVNLPDGKMKSREGQVVDADDLLSEVQGLVKAEVQKREDDVSELDLEKRSRVIALAAIKFYLLKVQPDMDITFDPRESISLEGATGPYIQYAYTRGFSVLKKAGEFEEKLADFSTLGNLEERDLIIRLGEYPEILLKTVQDLNPGKLANYLFDLARSFNSFYNQHEILTSDTGIKEARLILISSVANTLKNGLKLLGIETLEKM